MAIVAASATARRSSRSTAPSTTRPPRRSRWSSGTAQRSSIRRSRCTCASASTSATPRSSCAARWRCRTGSARRSTVAVFAEGDAARAATEAGADFVGAQDLADRVNDGWTDFDVAIATPALMGPVVSKLGRVLGPQGKMPNPKVGTVTDDVAKAVTESKAGKVEYRTDRQGIIHLTIGKTSFDERALLENYAAVIDEIVRAKPAAAKGRYLLSITLAASMGPGVRVDENRTRAAEILAGSAAAATARAATMGPPKSRPRRRSRPPPTARERVAGPSPAANLAARAPAEDRRQGPDTRGSQARRR